MPAASNKLTSNSRCRGIYLSHRKCRCSSQRRIAENGQEVGRSLTEDLIHKIKATMANVLNAIIQLMGFPGHFREVVDQEIFYHTKE